MSKEDPRGDREADPVLAYLEELDDETMSLAWGSDKIPEDRRRIILAATIFGQQFEERMREYPPENLEEKEFQRFLMALMNEVISKFADHEGMDQASAASFLGDIVTRDYVLEFNEVLEEFASDPGKSLDEHLRTAIENREARARWADHWSSG